MLFDKKVCFFSSLDREKKKEKKIFFGNDVYKKVNVFIFTSVAIKKYQSTDNYCYNL